MLCSICQRIPEWFFTKTFDTNHQKHVWQADEQNVVRHAPIQYMRVSANSGCSLCQIMSTYVNTSFLGPGGEWTVGLTLRRGLLDPNASFGLYQSILDDVAIKYFYQVPKAWSACLPPASPNAADDDYAQMKQWLNECEHKHSECLSFQVGSLPTRLIDVCPSTDSNHIVLKEKIPVACDVRYVALSHCWGPNSDRMYNTVAGNINDRLQHLSTSTLPESFKDAIAITRKLGFKYLWIDSLCIIQDQKEDCQFEVTRMGDIFAHAFCTLAAASSHSSSGGCRTQIDASETTRYADAHFGERRVRIFEKCPRAWNQEYSTNPLRRRAWVLQERLLSRRTINLSMNMLLWECATAKASGELPCFQMRIEDPPKTLILNDDSETYADPSSFAQREKWFDTVESYSQMLLSHEIDRLPAIAGLVANTKPPRGRYVAGMWENDMPSALLWHTEIQIESDQFNAFQPRRPMQMRAPSWSWVSVEGHVSYASQRLSGSTEERLHASTDYSDASFGFLGICAAQSVVPSNPVQIGASLLVSGLITTAFVGESWVSDTQPPKHKLLTRDRLVVGMVYPDIPQELAQHDTAHCFAIRTDPYWSEGYENAYSLYGTNEEDTLRELDLLAGLVLHKVDGTSAGYRRIGLLRLAPKKWFEDCHEHEITIY